MDQKIVNIQALRALAALAVLAAHLLSFDMDRTAAQTLPSVFNYGFAGVDLFFVISGFVMAVTTRGRFGSPRNAGVFLFSRAWRIYPVYWVYTLIAIGAFAAAGLLQERLETISVWRSFALWPQTGSLPLLAVGWTLVHEMYFYIVFAVFLLAPQRFLPVLLAVWGIAMILAGQAGLMFMSPAASIIFSPLTLEFIAGAVAGLLIASGVRRFEALALVLGAAGVVAGLLWLGPPHADSFQVPMRRAIAFAAPFALITYGAASLELERRARAPRAAVALGDWSYSLYLLHFLVIGTAFRLWNDRIAGPWDDLTLACAIALVSVLLAWLSYRWIERPILAAGGALRARLFGAGADARAPRTPGQASRIW